MMVVPVWPDTWTNRKVESEVNSLVSDLDLVSHDDTNCGGSSDELEFVSASWLAASSPLSAHSPSPFLGEANCFDVV
jgi:hypothetical protein